MFKYTDEQLSFIKENYKLTGKDLAERFNRKFRLKKTGNQLRSLCKRHGWKTGHPSRFEKGFIPWNAGTKGMGWTRANKTSFKKGYRPVNWRPVGSERVNIYGYIEVKTKEPKTWEDKRRVIWKKKHGAIPAGMVVRFKDNNPLNCKLKNLEIVSRRVHLRLNQSGYADLPMKLKPTAKVLAELEVKTFSLATDSH